MRGGILLTKDNVAAGNEYGDAQIAYNAYDFREISNRRKTNAAKWVELLHGLEKISLLKEYRTDITFQTFPIIVQQEEIRDRLYFILNEHGYGGVSLYHELIRPLYIEDYADSIYVSNHIFNLPVHQDIDESQIESMFELLIQIVEN